MIPQTFADNVGAISIHDGMVRIDLVTMVASQDDGEMTPVFKKRIVMSMPAFLRSHAGLQEVMKKLEEQNLIKRKNASPAKKKVVKAAPRQGAAAPKQPRKAASPNFPGVKKKD